MCIAIVTNSHPEYPLILLSNRDEFLQRPTAVADWWEEPHSYVLGGRDMHRAERGTWLGITKQGRIACLTNFREEGQAIIEGRRSRGAVVNSFLKTPADSTESPKDAAHKLISEGVDGIGGFSLLFGRLHGENNEKVQERGLAIVSNRSLQPEDVTWILQTPNETHALSNSHFEDKSWPKVQDAERLVKQGVQEAVALKEGKSDMINRFLDILSRDTLPRQKVGEEFEIYLRQLRHSIFIPAIGDVNLVNRKNSDQVAAANGTPTGVAKLNPTGGVYGTQKQSVMLVDRQGSVTFFERTLYDQLGHPIAKGDADRIFEFKIEGW
ncbi:uncharacterized protein PV09_01108 [Verruconis gallopava]|uniref:DUF833-domain-containing protein n=1 Tax=Verruconis gallopava TaxID=253628 RepID=A0A0D1Z5B8_9PEZI|nr:uncharacterized protein PV09_01108 [Verruconis gallopava]KIW08177.1 hypothetical protein PV09_01108 [Verruconis gallopava]